MTTRADRLDLAQDALVDVHAQIADLLAELQDATCAGFGIDPETAHWGHVGDLQRIRQILTDAVDVARAHA